MHLRPLSEWASPWHYHPQSPLSLGEHSDRGSDAPSLPITCLQHSAPLTENLRKCQLAACSYSPQTSPASAGCPPSLAESRRATSNPGTSLRGPLAHHRVLERSCGQPGGSWWWHSSFSGEGQEEKSYKLIANPLCTRSPRRIGRG